MLELPIDFGYNVALVYSCGLHPAAVAFELWDCHAACHAVASKHGWCNGKLSKSSGMHIQLRPSLPQTLNPLSAPHPPPPTSLKTPSPHGLPHAHPPPADVVVVLWHAGLSLVTSAPQWEQCGCKTKHGSSVGVRLKHYDTYWYTLDNRPPPANLEGGWLMHWGCDNAP